LRHGSPQPSCRPDRPLPSSRFPCRCSRRLLVLIKQLPSCCRRRGAIRERPPQDDDTTAWSQQNASPFWEHLRCGVCARRIRNLPAGADNGLVAGSSPPGPTTHSHANRDSCSGSRGIVFSAVPTRHVGMCRPGRGSVGNGAGFDGAEICSLWGAHCGERRRRHAFNRGSQRERSLLFVVRFPPRRAGCDAQSRLRGAGVFLLLT
jgi:hypothetical protein